VEVELFDPDDEPSDAPPLADVDERSLPSPDGPSLPSPDAPSPDAPSPDAAAFVFVPLPLERSFFAQPEPLKWTAGVTQALRSVPSAPHAGQNRGAGASIPWMNSVRVAQFEQT
jgi:hypothetical protein